jgi:excinuclease ABC subunit B
LVSAYKVAAEAVHASEEQLDRTELIAALEKEMFEAAEALEFEKAALLRDRIQELKKLGDENPDFVAAAKASTGSGQPFKVGSRSARRRR